MNSEVDAMTKSGPVAVSDCEDVGEDPVKVLHTRQKAEQRALQDEIVARKKSVNKTDKKKRKELNVWIATQEAEMVERHEKEQRELKESVNNVANSAMLTTELESGIENLDIQPRRVSKAEKRREKKAQQVKDREERIAEAETENADGSRSVELCTMMELLRDRGLKPFSVSSDGDCMFRAISHQLLLAGDRATVPSLRKLTADTLREDKDQYAPFIAAVDGDSNGDFEDYCDKMEKTPAWGGHVELQALSEALGRQIEVIQASGPPLTFGDADGGKRKLVIAYYRHAFGLGEHYDSTEAAA